MKPAVAFSLVPVLLLAFLGACALLERDFTASKAEALNREIGKVAIELANRLREFDPTDKTIAVATFVELDRLESTSSFGRLVAERLAAELYKLGFRVRELRQMSEVEIVPDKGELALSRRAERLVKKYRVDALVTGTYAMVGDEVMVSARLLSVDTARVVSVGKMVAHARMNSYIHDLLTRRSEASAPVVRVHGDE
ncbi:MAG: FlgO family outer membrane protein [Candidatus Nitrospinota bacterium M3_3B_026]